GTTCCFGRCSSSRIRTKRSASRTSGSRRSPISSRRAEGKRGLAPLGSIPESCSARQDADLEPRDAELGRAIADARGPRRRIHDQHARALLVFCRTAEVLGFLGRKLSADPLGRGPAALGFPTELGQAAGAEDLGELPRGVSTGAHEGAVTPFVLRTRSHP